MTLEERLQAVEDVLAVQALMARYQEACDGWDEAGTHRDPGAIASLFTEDGVWDVTDRDPPPEGRLAIEALAVELQMVPWILHTAVNPIVEPDGDVVHARFRGILRVRPDADARMVWSLGRYDLEARQTPDGWRIATLRWEPITASERFAPGAR